MTSPEGNRSISFLKIAQAMSGDTTAAGELNQDIRSSLGQEGINLLATFMLEQPQKTVVLPDGTSIQRDWTFEEFDFEMSKLWKEDEKSFRSSFGMEIVKSINAQQRFGIEIEQSSGSESEQQIEFISALADEVLSSDENFTMRAAPNRKEAYLGAQLLEVYRRTILQPVDVFFERVYAVPGYDHEEPPWDEMDRLRTEEMAEVLDCGKIEEFRRLDSERIDLLLSSRTDAEWAQIIQKNGDYILGYLKGRISRASNEARRFLAASEIAEVDGVKVVSEERISELRNFLSKMEDIDREVLQLEGFGQVKQWMVTRWGEEATFQNLVKEIQVLNLYDFLKTIPGALS